ncbi:hypothetical protein D1610_05855 [Sphingomonas gilva]|uniref:Uncharacterized protein n=1 Tax=Sphingomonas gilva TaxID=2305907 RepID=A0A396RNH7_9SPHN|nr:hypothetical protein [Sphingomonas gilva]RHW18020.1 hypothetical protein D1610_05855 [Sphingomonas gilva]
MTTLQTLFTVLAAWLVASPGPRPDTSSGACANGREDVTAERPHATDGAQADLLVAMAMSPKLAKITREAVIDRPSACRRGGFAVGSARYMLTGDDGDGMVPRRAHAEDAGAPVAYLLSTIDMQELVASADGGEPAGTLGYALMTSTEREDVAWAFYKAMPADRTLRADMARALSGEASPIFRTDRRTSETQFVAG